MRRRGQGELLTDEAEELASLMETLERRFASLLTAKQHELITPVKERRDAL